MKLDLSKPILYLITPGETTEATTPSSPEFAKTLKQIETAVAIGIELIQIREKRLNAHVLFELTARATDITRGNTTRLLVNDRSDIAVAAGADGVHLTTTSLSARTIRRTFGDNFLIGASTHSLSEAIAAHDDGADFGVLGPVFETKSKVAYDSPLGTDVLADICAAVKPFPILALGGVSPKNAIDCLRAGAHGVAGIRLFSDTANVQGIVASISRQRG